MNNLRKVILCLALLVSQSGCKEEIAHNLTETEANKIISVVFNAGIDAVKNKQSDGKWSIEVEKNNFAEVLQLIESRHLLQNEKEIREEGNGFLLSDQDRQLKYQREIALQIERTLRSLSGVIDTKVNLYMAPQDPLGLQEKDRNNSGSVLLLTLDDFTISKDEIESLVSGASGIDKNKITVLIKANEKMKTFIEPAKVIKQGGNDNRKVAGSFVLLFTGVLISYYGIYYKKQKI